MPDFIINQGDTEPSYADQLAYSNGEVVNLTGATVRFTIRAFTSSRPVALTGTVTITKATAGEVSYTFSQADTALAGAFMASWLVVFADGARMTFPTEGYIWLEVQPNLLSGEAKLVGLPEVTDHLGIPPQDRTHDAKLSQWINAAQVLIENLTGPIVLDTYDEWYEGGHSTISLRHKPSFGFGTEPVLNLLAVSEYRGPIEYNLSIVGTPTQGSVYSVMLNAELGTVVRRTSGGGTYAFWSDPSHPQQSIHVVYEAGQATVPENVNLACIETLRWWFDTTQQVGKGRQTLADAEVGKPMVALPYHVISMLGPTARYPSLA